MKLRNKKTGEIIEIKIYKTDKSGFRDVFSSVEGEDSLAELNEEWEDYNECEYWYIDNNGDVMFSDLDGDKLWENLKDERKTFGNYFETEEEAEKAVEKLKAWKRLRDKGFRFILDEETEMPMFIYSGANGEKCITNAEESKQCRSDIKLLFGGEE